MHYRWLIYIYESQAGTILPMTATTPQCYLILLTLRFTQWQRLVAEASSIDTSLTLVAQPTANPIQTRLHAGRVAVLAGPAAAQSWRKHTQTTSIKNELKIIFRVRNRDERYDECYDKNMIGYTLTTNASSLDRRRQRCGRKQIERDIESYAKVPRANAFMINSCGLI